MALCESCQDEEMGRAWDCYAKERAAKEAGLPFECTCPTLVCTHDKDGWDGWWYDQEQGRLVFERPAKRKP